MLQPLHRSIGIATIVGVLTLSYHLLLAERYYGIGFFLFVLLLVVATHALVYAAGSPKNPWAYALLVPVLFSALAEFLYANDRVMVLAPLITIVSLVLFTYWFSAPRVTVAALPSFWTRSLFLETIVPIQGLKSLATHWKFGQTMSRVLIGAVLAVPFLFIIFALFMDADLFFQQTVGRFLDNISITEATWKILRDGTVAVFFACSAWAMVNRVLEGRHPLAMMPIKEADSVILRTFLALLNALFLFFLAFQMVYFFGGESMLQQRGVTYAEYARQGYSQLITISIIVLGIAWYVYRVTNMKEFWTRTGAVALMAQTGVLLVSAYARLRLYVDAYGWTVSRWWGIFGILVIACVLVGLFGAIALKQSYRPVGKALTLFGLYTLSGVLLVNTEAIVVRWNADRYLSRQTQRLDLTYMSQYLSSDAIPAIIETMERTEKWDNVQSLTERLIKLENKREESWLNVTWSDRRAIEAIDRLR